MTRNRRRFLCFALAALMLAALLPAVLPAGVARAEDTLGIVTKENVNFRVGPSMSDKLLFRIPIRTVCVVKKQVTANGYEWYQIQAKDPDRNNSPVYTGYIRGDCFRLLSESEVTSYTGVLPSTTGDPNAGVSAGNSEAPADTYGWVTAGGVNMRISPGKDVIRILDRGTQVKVLTIPPVISSSNWYKVEYDGVEGYIMSTFLNLNGSGPIITADPGTVVTPAPDTSGILGYVKTIKGSVNIRASAGGTSLTTVGKYETFPYLLPPVTKGGYTWYFVQVKSNLRGYIRGDCVKVTSSPGGGGSVTPVTAGPVVTATPTPAPGTPTGYVKTTTGYVNIRKGVWGDRIGIAKNEGTVYAYYGTPIVKNGITWYYIATGIADHPYGYIHGGFVKETDESGAVVTPVPATTPTPTGGGSSETTTPTGNVAEATYTTLKNGSSGQAVTNLVTELKNQGFFSGSITSKYNSTVENAVRAFQKAKGLAVDGIAGPLTQHALFNTVPVGTADIGNREITLYPAEKIDWNTGGIQELWPRGANVKVYDVKSGYVFWAHRWAGGLHVDAEPLTAADTAIICKIQGVSKASQITENTHWQRRPALVTIGTRTFACSMYLVPHNPEGDTIADNNFVGQFCIHFTNSKTHGSKKVDTLHTEAIEYAWLNAPNGHK